MKKKRRLLNFIYRRKNPILFSKLFNLYTAFSRLVNKKNFWQIRTRPDRGVILVEDDDGNNISILHSERAGFYRNGIYERVTALLKDYHIDIEDINNDDVFIDCGANIGEIGLGLRLSEKKARYIAFEPGHDEAMCCRINNPHGTCEQLALWYEKTKLKFFEKSDSADSSLIEFKGYASVTEVETTTIDEYCDENGIGDIKYLKVEGEGAEPEILRGAKRTLQRVKYICVDCGPERGFAKESTLPEVCDFLIANGFKFEKVSQGRLTARFVRL